MLFTIGVELPNSPEEAFGLVVPALCNDNYACFSAADNQEEIAVMAREAILGIIEDMAENNIDVESIKDTGVLSYRANPEYEHCTLWCLVEVDLSPYTGKQKRINISIPESLIGRIDATVASSHGKYKDRSHFLSVAARNQINAG